MVIRIKRLSGGEIFAFSTPCDNREELIREHVSGDAECFEDEIGFIETDDGDQITARGVPYARIEYAAGWNAFAL
jgi:hypothetical protein